MAGGGAGISAGVSIENQGNKNYGPAIALMSTLFFFIGFVTVLNDVLITTMQGIFNFSENENWKLMLIQFCFFLAYGVMSYPAGEIIKKVGYKRGTILSLFVVSTGLILFYPASLLESYGMFLIALFIVGNGFAILQVAINPYLIALGTPETGASRLNLGGALNSTATAIGPIFGSYALLNECLNALPAAEAQHEKLALVQMPYLIIAAIFILMAFLIMRMNLPVLKIENKVGEVLRGSIFEFKHLLFGAGAIFFYVGAEVVIGSILGIYLRSDTMGALPERAAVSLIAYYWAGAMIGRFAGSHITKTIAPNKALAFVAFMALIMISLSMTNFMISSIVSVPILKIGEDCVTGAFQIGVTSVAVPLAGVCLISIGLFNSIMWPSIFPLGIARLGKYTSKGSGIMVTMVAGGAFVSLFQGVLADAIGYRFSFITCLVCYGYILFFALKGYKPEKVADNDLDEIRRA